MLTTSAILEVAKRCIRKSNTNVPKSKIVTMKRKTMRYLYSSTQQIIIIVTFQNINIRKPEGLNNSIFVNVTFFFSFSELKRPYIYQGARTITAGWFRIARDGEGASQKMKRM